MEDVSQCEEDGGLALQLPLRAFLLHQPPFLCGQGGKNCEGQRAVESPQHARPRRWLTMGSSSTLSTAWKQPSSSCARTRSALGGSCRGR